MRALRAIILACAPCCVIQVVKYVALTDNHVVCDEGLESTEFYMVMSGKFMVKVTVPGLNSARVRRGVLLTWRGRVVGQCQCLHKQGSRVVRWREGGLGCRCFGGRS